MTSPGSSFSERSSLLIKDLSIPNISCCWPYLYDHTCHSNAFFFPLFIAIVHTFIIFLAWYIKTLLILPSPTFLLLIIHFLYFLVKISYLTLPCNRSGTCIPIGCQLLEGQAFCFRHLTSLATLLYFDLVYLFYIIHCSFSPLQTKLFNVLVFFLQIIS